MDLKIVGTVKQILEEVTGEGKNGPWRKQEFILETDDNYPKQVCIVMWGENIDKFALKDGERIAASVDIASREYNGRWYTDVKAWRVERDQGGSDGPPSFEDEPFPEPSHGDDEDDGLPF